jgi:6-phosphofructokinase 1
MSGAQRGNLLVIQGGGPTAVINTTLFGVIDEAMPRFDRVLGARFGIEGLVRGDLLDLSAVPRREIERLKDSPGASLGSTRHKADASELDRIVGTLRLHDVRALIVIGGNGSLRGAEAIADAVRRERYDCCVVGAPKTIDNDIVGTDRCPGFASAARYIAQAVRDLGMDVRTLPQPVSLFETMGRSVGWLAGASVLAKIDADHAPHLVCLPERPFDVARFLGDIDRVVRKHGWAVAVVTEGLKAADGQPIYENVAASQRDALNRALPGGVASHLANVVTRELKIRCRWEKARLCARASMLHVSEQDRRDAEIVGRAAVRAAIEQRHAHCGVAPTAGRRGSNGNDPAIARRRGRTRHARCVAREFRYSRRAGVHRLRSPPRRAAHRIRCTAQRPDLWEGCRMNRLLVLVLIAVLFPSVVATAIPIPADEQYVKSLDGTWRFKLEQAKGDYTKGEKPQIAPDYPKEFEPFYKPDYKEADGWHDIKVPGNWEMAGHSPATYNQPDKRLRLLPPELRRAQGVGRPDRQAQLRRRAERRGDLAQRRAGQGR